ncbi:sugar kinase [Naumannella sp. ID2617S]|uniref:Carbohydrate kinase n=1 Tax=Enemella dayhoffiae TaxID=2016507 RepID=A0A255GRX3_9ACTN|nr:sugar kinase [Enemella dayhoffiae]NNG21324.1 sugar kinase [Naumannella sp. ID2617S]OYO18321.1 carbohydrate kinase [Enemella dayhoffiae]
MASTARGPAICIGESMTLLTPPAGSSLSQADSVELHVAGAEGNVACGLAHLGVDVEWLSRVGADPMGQRILGFLRSRGIGTDRVEVDPARPTGVMFKDRVDGRSVVHYYRRGSAAAAMGAEVLGGLGTPALIHLSGINPVLSDSLAELAEGLLARRELGRTPISFDVNHRPALWSADQAAEPLGRLADLADVVLVGLDEAERLWGCTTAEQVRNELPGARTIVVKDADVGAWHLDDTETVFQPALKLDIVDVVGAGDAFAAGYLAALLSGRTPQVRLRLGHLLAALTIQSTADAPPLPDRSVLWELADTGAGWDRLTVGPAALDDAELLRGKETR